MSENPTCSTSYPQAGAGPSRSLPLPIKARTWSAWQGYALKRTGPVSSFYSLVLDIEGLHHYGLAWCVALPQAPNSGVVSHGLEPPTLSQSNPFSLKVNLDSPL